MSALERTVLQVMGMSAGGIATHVRDIYEALDGGDGLRIEIAGPRSSPVAMPDRMFDLHVPDGPVRGHAGAVRRIREIARETECDLIHAHGLRAGIDAALAGRALRVPVLLTIHNLVQPAIAGRLKARVYRRAEAIAARLADHVLCVSEQIARHLRHSVPRAADKVEVLYLGLADVPEPKRSAHEIREELAITPEVPLLVTVARLAPQKALHVLLQAVAGMEGAHLMILGEGPLEAELRSLADSLSLSERVHFLGFRREASSYVAAADVFCLSSVWEGVPLAAQEAIQLGTPIVSTDVGGMSELVIDGHSGRLCAPGDPVGLRDAIQDVLADGDRAGSFAARAKEGLEERFSRTRMLERLTAFYKEGVGG